MEPIILKKSLKKDFLLIAALLAFAAGGWFLATHSEEKATISWACTAIGAFTIFNLNMPKDKLAELLCERLDEHGACRF